ncbi:hypothetical protein M2324_003649 [Rhodovulum sulfidophilum]|uniref:hypothetical protein n=1 Tax=Rhodovulum sulfidophilum TaxID=35806 RepID=UPI000A87202E|nr:hypothetical protein [Rhodovulum sulfidophilum]MCW2305230.1 hypothetical protein [Rhodovulum sulfidophilum]
MKYTILAAGALAFLSACNPAQLGVSGSLTSKGYINRSEVSLGNVYLWDRSSETARRVNFVDPDKHPLIPRSAERDETVTFKQGAEVSGNVELTEAEISNLSLEVARRSSVAGKALSSEGFRDPLAALLNEIRADKERWYRSLELDENFRLEDNVVLVLVSEVTIGNSLRVEVDKTAAAGATFSSRTVSTARGDLKFEISDTNQIDVTNADGSVLFARMIPYTASQGPNGVRFATVRDKEAVADLAEVLASGL